MINFLKQPKTLLFLFVISSLILGWNIAEIINHGLGDGKELLIQVLHISGWIFITIFFFYYFTKSKSRNKD